MSELATVVKYNVSVTIIVANNHLYELEKQKMKYQGLKPFGVDVSVPDFAALANTFGVKGKRVTNTEELEPIMNESISTEGPVVVDVQLLTMHIVYDNHDKIIDWVINYIDQKLNSNIGESQRKPEAPPEKILVREGLKALDKLAKQKYNLDFLSINVKQQFEILAALQLGKADQISEWSQISQKALFKKLAGLIITVYYSHPTIWSEIGYGDPAYPRGYVRVEFGLADPWEAKTENASRSGFGEEDTPN